MSLYSEHDWRRELAYNRDEDFEFEEYRKPWRIDYARLIHSPCFRRLQGKTQLYPGIESDFFRNRLTHSLEVAQIAKSIAIRINHRFLHTQPTDFQILPDVCEFAGLAHDLGHPPFGHQGELALNQHMSKEGGFEGNAQTLRLLSKIEKKHEQKELNHGFDNEGNDRRVGLNLTYRSLGSILKYDNVIPQNSDGGIVTKGYYHTEKALVERIKKAIVGDSNHKLFKTVECQIMDIADDIAYSTYDLEDAMKAGFYTPFDILYCDDLIIERIANKASDELGRRFSNNEIRDGFYDLIIGRIINPDLEYPESFDIEEKEELTAFASIFAHWAYKTSNSIARNGFYRTAFSSKLIGEFIRGIEFNLNKDNPPLSTVSLNEEIEFKVFLLKTFTFESQILSPKLKIAEFRGQEIVSEIFKALSQEHEGWRLMPSDYQKIYSSYPDKYKSRIICDFIAGMTDRYAIEFYGRLKSENPKTIFKPF